MYRAVQKCTSRGRAQMQMQMQMQYQRHMTVAASPSSTRINSRQPSMTTQRRWLGVPIMIVEEKSGLRVEIDATEGKTVLDMALENDVDIEGACGGQLACSTCHVILSQELYNKLLPEKLEEEDDMLDLAWGLTDTSRLCCQIKVTKELAGAVFRVPTETNNML